jgi:putative FmdB family regulatory protein
MPVYDHYCHGCDSITEHICKIKDRKQFVPCKECGGSAERIITAKIQRDEPLWLDSAVSNLADDAAPQIKSRTEFNKYLAANNIVQRG